MRYDITKSFEQNKKEWPQSWDEIKDRNDQIQDILGEYGIFADFFWYKTNLPIGVAAGPLFNEKYMMAAAMDGFSVITWKTFRSEERLAHRNDGSYTGHNVVYLNRETPLQPQEMWGYLEGSLENTTAPEYTTITNSFGMWSDEPSIWMPQVTEIEKRMTDHNKKTIASVVASPKDDWTMEQLADDYTQTALKAEASWATVIEFNLSCPNVCSSEGSIYKSPETTAFICEYAKKHLQPSTKLLIKIWYNDKQGYKKLLEPTLPHIDGIVAINTIPMKVVDGEEKQALPGGLTTGTCGYAINDLSTEAVWYLAELRREEGRDFKLIWCGGVMSAASFMKHIDAGADFVMCATAAWFNPDLPMQIAEYLRDQEIKKHI